MESHKAYIVSITHKNINEKTYIQIFGRLENGKSFCSINEFAPYFYIKESDEKKVSKLLKNFKTEKTSSTNFKKSPVIKISSEIHSELQKLYQAIHKNVETYEADLSPSMRYIIDNKLLGNIEISGENSQSEAEQKIDLFFNEPKISLLSTEQFSPKLKVLSIDIESSKSHSSDELFCIGLYSENYKKVLLRTKENEKIQNTINCKSESELLSKFKEEIIAFDPDIITGWNVIDFDFAYLKRKFDEHKIPFDIGRTNSPVKIKIESNFFRNSSISIPGRQVLDGLNLIRDPFIKEAPSIKNKNFESYTLDNVSEQILGDTKLIKGKNRHDEIEKLYKTDKKKLVEYNLKDCELAYKILEKTKTIELAIERTSLTGLPLNKLTASIAAFDSLYIREANKRGLVSPTLKFSQKEERIKGGFVMSPIPGIYHNVLVLDFKSLYPSIIKTFNIDPASYLEKPSSKQNTIESPNKAHFMNNDGILPDIIATLHKAREKAKREKREFSSYAIKIMMNCFSPDTEILTENGVKNIEDVNIGEKVYSINPKNNNIELHPIAKKFIYPYKGKMIRIKSNVVDYLVTPNHRFLVDFGKGYVWKEAKDLVRSKKDFWLPEHTNINGKKIKKINLEKLCKKYKITYRKKENKLQKGPKHSSIFPKFKIEDWLELVGWYISEGHIYTSKPKRYLEKTSWRGVTKVVMINQKISEKRDKIKDLFKRMKIKYCEQFNGISVNNHILAEVLENECGIGSSSKRIPKWVYGLSPDLLKKIFNSLMDGDGDTKGDRYSTKSNNLAKDFLRLIHHMGIYGFIYTDTSEYKGEKYGMYRIQINKNRGIKPYISPKRNISEEDFEGDVLCVEVKPHHTILAGRKTKLNFCGQSFFGVLASPNCRYFNLKIANAITHFGQDIIKLTAKKIEEKFKTQVIYSDTDSVFVNSNLEKEKANSLGNEIQNYINNFYDEYAQKNYKRKSYLELEFEKQYLSFFLPKVRGSEAGAKKRYAGLIEKDSKEKIQIVGLESIRGDWTDAAQEFQTQLLQKVFHKENPILFIKNFIKNLKAGKINEKLIYRKSIRKKLEEYTKTTPPHVKAARLLDKLESNIIEYVITTNGPEPIQKQKHKIDYEHYINKQIKPIADTILFFFKTNLDDILKNSKQAKLF